MSKKGVPKNHVEKGVPEITSYGYFILGFRSIALGRWLNFGCVKQINCIWCVQYILNVTMQNFSFEMVEKWLKAFWFTKRNVCCWLSCKISELGNIIFTLRDWLHWRKVQSSFYSYVINAVVSVGSVMKVSWGEELFLNSRERVLGSLSKMGHAYSEKDVDRNVTVTFSLYEDRFTGPQSTGSRSF